MGLPKFNVVWEGVPRLLRRRKTPLKMVKVKLRLLHLIVVTLNVIIVWVLVILLHSIQTRRSGLQEPMVRLSLKRRIT